MPEVPYQKVAALRWILPMHTYQSVVAVGLLTVAWTFSLQPISYSLHNSSLSIHTQEVLASKSNNGVEPHRGSGR